MGNEEKEKIKQYVDFFMEVCEENGIAKEKCNEIKVELIKDIIVAMATQKLNLEGMEKTFRMMLQSQISQGGEMYG